jgi:MFS family permease
MSDPKAESQLDEGANSVVPDAVLRKVAWRLVPFLCLLFIFNILDRTNVGFARLTMKDALGMTDEDIDWGYGFFYIGYLAFEVPANLLLRWIGARRWLARIMITWGIVSCTTLAVSGAWSFAAVRIALGVAEAGFFPGIIFYLTAWFPARQRTRMMAYFMSAIPIAGVIGNPLSGAVMQYLDGWAGLAGWQWLFLCEGVPSIVLGFAVLFLLADGPNQASWLRPQDGAWLIQRLEQEEKHRTERHGADLWAAFIDPRVWLLICLYFTVALASNAAGAHFPKLIKASFAAANDFKVGLLAALPHVAAIIGMTVLGTHSDRTGERRGHVALAAFLAAAGWTLSLLASDSWLFLGGLCIAQLGMMSMLPTFWALPTSFLSGAAAAGGIALINSVGNVGGLVGPPILGKYGLGAMIAIMVVGGILALCARHDPTLDKSFPLESRA